MHENQDGGFFTPAESDLAADWSEQTHHQTRNNEVLDHNKKGRYPVSCTSGNHKLIRQSETLTAAKTDSNTVENKTLSSSLNMFTKPFEPKNALYVADVVRVNKSKNYVKILIVYLISMFLERRQTIKFFTVSALLVRPVVPESVDLARKNWKF